MIWGGRTWAVYKHYGHEGGIATPAIIHWPAGMTRKGEMDGRPSYLPDVMATCLELAGAPYPVERNGYKILSPEGKSLVGLLKGKSAEGEIIFMEHEGNRAIRDGRWKLVALAGHPWELYDMEKDRVEMTDLALRSPVKVKELEAKWKAWAARVNVAPKPK